MSKYITNRSVLDKQEPLEAVLEIMSFSGGTNTIATDQELSSNDARRIDNWEAISLGGMIRSKGVNLVASANTSVEPVVFTGAGLNDATAGGTYSGAADAVFEVEITAEGTPDTFKWKKDSGAYTTGVTITAGAMTLTEGVTITFAATTGHTTGNKWSITTNVYTAAPDLGIQHFEGASTTIYSVVEGDLLYYTGSALAVKSLSAFTSGILCHAVSAGNKCWITNSTDNLKYSTISAGIATPTTQPATACDRIYEHQSRLIAEGNASKIVYGSVPGVGAWAGAGGWTTAGSSWSATLPDITQGCIPGFPSSTEVLVFTEYGAYSLYNFPNVAWRPITGAAGCSGPYTIARASDGVFFYSKYPKKGIMFSNGVNITDLTVNSDFINELDDSKRMFGVYKDNKYWFIYNETGSGVSTPDMVQIYDTRFGRWWTRRLNPEMAHYLGYPFLLTRTNNELYCCSADHSAMYEADVGNEDEGTDVVASYRTKDFTSRDFSMASGGSFPIDGVRIKLAKVTIKYYNIEGNITVLANGDRSRLSISKTITSRFEEGARINSDFTLNESMLISEDSISDKQITVTFPNSAVARSWSFEINNSGKTTRPKIYSVKIHALLYEEI